MHGFLSYSSNDSSPPAHKICKLLNADLNTAIEIAIQTLQTFPNDAR